MTFTPPVIVEVHSHTEDVRNVEHLMRSVSWTESISAPWSTINLLPDLGRSGFLKNAYVLPAPGEWVVIRQAEKSPALAWGVVVGARTGIAGVKGAIAPKPVAIQAISWLAYLGSIGLIASPAINTSIGTLFSMTEWGLIWNRAFQSGLTSPGLGLEAIMSLLPKVLLPPTLGGIGLAAAAGNFTPVARALSPSLGIAATNGTIAEAIKVVHDFDTRLSYAPGRTVESVVGPSLGILKSSRVRPEATPLSVIVGTFEADPLLVELFPSLELPGELPDPLASLDGSESDYIAAGSGHLRLRTSRSGASPEELIGGTDPTATPKTLATSVVQQVPKLATGAAKALGKNPVLIYRMRPWREQPLDAYIARLSPSLPSGFGITGGLFNAKTWDNATATKIERSDVVEVDLEYDNAENINATTVTSPILNGGDLRFWEQNGLPLMSSPDNIRTDGLRLYQLSWPFLVPQSSAAIKGIWRTLVQALAAQTFMYAVNAGRFSTGMVQCRYRPDIHHGTQVRVQLPDGFGGEELSAYADAVTHNIDLLENGAVRKRTIVHVTRGLFNEKFRTVIGAIVGGERV